MWYSMTSCPRPGTEPRGAVGYGTSETVGMMTYEGRLPVGTGTFGRPGPAMAVRIVDPDGAEVPVGQIGEIVARGPQAMTGYLGLEPMDPQGWRWTGDLGRREADGSFTFLGPNQEMIKTGMENVYPVEVENALKEQRGGPGRLRDRRARPGVGPFGPGGRRARRRRVGGAGRADRVRPRSDRQLQEAEVGGDHRRPAAERLLRRSGRGQGQVRRRRDLG